MSTETSLGENEWELFRYSNDPFVNEGAVELGRNLANAGVARITKRAVVATKPPEQVLPKLRAELFGSNGVINNTHRRTSRAYHVNALSTGTLSNGESDDVDPDWLGDNGNGPTIPAATEPFPGSDDDATVFPGDELSDTNVEQLGLDANTINRDEANAYSLHPAYLGAPTADGFERAKDRAEIYFDIFEDVLTGDHETVADDTTCMTCGSSLPNWRWKLDGENTDLEYGQSFTPMATKSGRPMPLGQKSSQQSYYRGRCPACLLAGFYYLCMPIKPLASTGDSGAYRVFSAKGDFEAIETVRRAYEQTVGLNDLATPTANGTIRLGSFSVWSAISEVQAVAFYAALLEALSEDPVADQEALFADLSEKGTDVSLTGAISVRSAPSKGGRAVRSLTAFREAPATRALYERLREQTRDTAEGPETYAPYNDVLAWYIGFRNPNIETEIAVDAKRDLAQGVLDGNLAMLERGVFGLLKQLAGDAESPYAMSVGRHQHYFQTIMADIATNIDSDTRDSIKNVGRSIGQMFAERDDLSVLQSFHHANSPDQFLSAFEKASMGAVKKSHDTGEVAARSTFLPNSSVNDLLGAISDEETFEAAKQMFVIHASLSAHYQNSTATDNTDN
ncbi:hypothetical protein [Natronococcus amylolyticus]|uniref:hypothetical protein n=1 Tax=Natronococcus amylolyticus TaxID=44470 RepID=UPI00126952FF|nr:hypothetical protein [Natronococcus amylolyticus]